MFDLTQVWMLFFSLSVAEFVFICEICFGTKVSFIGPDGLFNLNSNWLLAICIVPIDCLAFWWMLDLKSTNALLLSVCCRRCFHLRRYEGIIYQSWWCVQSLWLLAMEIFTSGDRKYYNYMVCIFQIDSKISQQLGIFSDGLENFLTARTNFKFIKEQFWNHSFT